MLRSILAILAGYLVFGISAALLFNVSGQDPRLTPGIGFIVFSSVYGAAFALLAGYFAAAFAGRRPLLHASILAGLLGAIALASLISKLGNASPWSEIAVLVLMVPAAMAGGFLRQQIETARG
jgi:hypothetical protein